MTVPAIFRDSKLWFRLWQAAERDHEQKQDGISAIYMLRAVIDGGDHYIRFAVGNNGTPLRMSVSMHGPEVWGYMGYNARVGIGFEIAYDITWRKGTGVEAIDPRYAVNGGEPMRFIISRYAKRMLPDIHNKTDHAAIEHVVMMFVLSAERKKS